MDLSSYTIKNLKTKCKDLGIKNYSNKNKSDLIQLISNKLNNSKNQNKQEKKNQKMKFYLFYHKINLKI